MKKLLFVFALSLLAASHANAQQARKIFTTSAVAADSGVLENGFGIQYHQLVWNVTGTVTGCTVELDSSADNITWGGTVITGQTCTSNGASATSALTVANYVRINVTAFTGSGSVTVTYLGYTSASGGGAGGILGCTTSGGVVYENGTNNTGTCGPALTWNSATNQLNVGLTSGLTNAIFTNIISQQTTSLFSGVATAGNPNNYPITAVSQSTNSTTTSGVYTTSVATGNLDSSDFAVEADAYSAASMGTTQTMNGAIISFVQNNGPGNVTDLFSVAGQTNNLLGTTTRMSAFLAFAPFTTNGTGGTVTNVYGYQAQGQQTIIGATLNAAYHADDQGTNAKSFSFYSAGGQNRLLGSSGQTLPTLDVAATSTATSYGAIGVFRGTGTGMVPAEGEGAVLEVNKENNSSVNQVWWSKSAPANNSFDVNVANDGSVNLDHSTNGTEFDFLSFNADGSEQANPAAGKGFLAPLFIAGTDNSVAGSVQIANGSAAAHTIFSSAATTTNTIAGFATVPTTNHLVSCVVSGTVCTLTDSGSTTGSFATTTLNNLGTTAINAALLSASNNTLALGASNNLWTNLFSTALNCGLGGTTSCVITGNGSTSGTATITWPAVAGTITNPIRLSNSLQLPSGTVYNWNGDTGLSRDSATVVDVGNGTPGDKSGQLQAAFFISGLGNSASPAIELNSASLGFYGVSTTDLLVVAGGSVRSQIDATAFYIAQPTCDFAVGHNCIDYHTQASGIIFQPNNLAAAWTMNGSGNFIPVDNTYSLGDATHRASNLFVTAETCGLGGTTSCVLTGAGSASGTATLTWPATAGTASNPIASSNNLSMPGLTLTGSAPAITASGTTPYINASAPLIQMQQCSFALTTSTLTTAASPVNLCTITLPNAAVVWRVNCQGGWSVTAGTTPTFAVGNNWAQTPSGVFGAGDINTTNAGVGVQGTTSSTSNGNVLATGTLTTSATIFTTTWWTTFTGSATSGAYHPTASVTGVNATGTLVGFCTIQ